VEGIVAKRREAVSLGAIRRRIKVKNPDAPATRLIEG
jgi:hypothetical protein